MKISVDAGALCSPHKFGTYVVAHNILDALGQFDKENSYTGYIYKRSSQLPTAANLKYKVLHPKFGWMSLRVSAEELLHPKDIYLGLSQAIPWVTRAKVISFLHGLSFFYHKDLYTDSYEALKDQVMFATTRSQKIIVSSAKVRAELEEQFGYKDAVVLPFGIPSDMVEQSALKKTQRPYFLFVGMSHQIKNVQFLVQAFTIFKEQQSHRDFELILVGDHGQFADEKLSIRSVKVDRAELRDLYSNATGYLSSSLYESFNLPVLEALSQNCRVIGKSSAIIPELREFVTVADMVEDFVDGMKSLVSAKKSINNEKISEKFSWEKYVNKLTSFYSS